MKSVAEVLSDSNRALLKVIRETQPESVADLAKKTGRQRSKSIEDTEDHVQVWARRLETG